MNLQKQISEMSAGVAEGVARQKYGSYSERNPLLGKMMTCQFCHARRRQFALDACCNPVQTAVVSDGPKHTIKKFTHKRHSNKTRHQLHDLGIALKDEAYRNSTHLLLDGLPGFWTPANEIPESHIPSMAEKVLTIERKHKARQKRKQQQDARRINFGLKRGLDG